MEHLLEALDCIVHRLEEIYNISCNQEAVIIALKGEPQSKESFLKLLEEMVQNKEEVMNELEELEMDFNNSYYEAKPLLEATGKMKMLKEKVEQVLKIKAQIVDKEENNNRLMGSVFRGQLRPAFSKVMEVPKNASQVIRQYSKFNK